MKKLKALMKRIRENEKGFTLVELIIVIAIIGVLAGIATPSVMGYLTQAREEADEATAATILHAVQTAIVSHPEDIADEIDDIATADGAELDDGTIYDAAMELLPNSEMPNPQQTSADDEFTIFIGNNNTIEIRLADEDTVVETGNY